jgi:16S rRNA U516 pseudouridylate synthase RsuA-like enzyme
MAKRKRKLTAAEQNEKKRRRAEYMIIVVNGKQKRVKRPPMVEGMTVEEFVRANADPIWLHENEMREEMPKEGLDGDP